MLAVLDWELSTLGHPLADFATTAWLAHRRPAQFRGIARARPAQRSASRPKREYVATLLRAHRPRPIRQADWNFYLAYNMFRIAAILQGIMKRVVDGTASSAQARRCRPAARGRWPRLALAVSRAASALRRTPAPFDPTARRRP